MNAKNSKLDKVHANITWADGNVWTKSNVDDQMIVIADDDHAAVTFSETGLTGFYIGLEDPFIMCFPYPNCLFFCADPLYPNCSRAVYVHPDAVSEQHFWVGGYKPVTGNTCTGSNIISFGPLSGSEESLVDPYDIVVDFSSIGDA